MLVRKVRKLAPPPRVNRVNTELANFLLMFSVSDPAPLNLGGRGVYLEGRGGKGEGCA